MNGGCNWRERERCVSTNSCMLASNNGIMLGPDSQWVEDVPTVIKENVQKLFIII